jgi:hydrogenase maturation protease
LALPDVEVVDTSVTGFHLFDHILDTRRLVVIDTILTGTAEPGTIFRLRETDIQSVPGSSQHYVGLFEALGLGRGLHLPVPKEVSIIAVQAADCSTVGGRMHPAVAGAIPAVVNLARDLVGSSSGDWRCA